MKNVFKGLTVIGLAALMVGCGAANTANNTNVGEKIDEQTTNNTDAGKDQTTAQNTNTSTKPNEQNISTNAKPNTQNTNASAKPNAQSTTPQNTSAGKTTNTALLNQFAPGTYCVAVDGMRARAAATVNSAVVEQNFQKGVALNIVEVKLGDDDSNSVWGRVESPFQGWICLKDANMQYLMTQDQFAKSGIMTNASPVQQQGLGSGVYANPDDPAEQDGIGSGVYATPDDSVGQDDSGAQSNSDDSSMQDGMGSGVYATPDDSAEE